MFSIAVVRPIVHSNELIHYRWLQKLQKYRQQHFKEKFLYVVNQQQLLYMRVYKEFPQMKIVATNL